MRRIVQLASPVIVTALAACADSSRPTAPAATDRLAAAESSTPSAVATVRLRDRCDPATFNAALGPGTCTFDDPGVTFQQFLQQLRQTGIAPAWRFEPRRVSMNVGETLRAVNVGGEVHTFTEVDEFGGGIVPLLNDLSGNRIVAPECRTLAQGDFLPPGASVSEVETTPGVEHYMCCIHPWMRATVTIR